MLHEQRVKNQSLTGVIIGLISISLVLVSGIQLLLVRNSSNLDIFLAVLVGFLLLTPIIVNLVNNKFDLFEPIVMIGAVFSLYFVLHPLYSIYSGETSILGMDVFPLYAKGLLGVMVAVGSCWFGYFLPVGKKIGMSIPFGKFSHRGKNQRSLFRFGLGLLVLSSLSFFLWLRISEIPWEYFFLPGLLTGVDPDVLIRREGVSLNYLFLQIEMFIPAILIFSMSDSLKSRVFTSILFVLVLIIYSSIGFRFRISVLVSSFIVFYFLCRNKKPKLFFLFGTFILIFFFFGWLSDARGFIRSQGISGDTKFSFSNSAAAINAEFKIFDTFSVLIDAMPARLDYVYFAPYKYIFILPIPHQIWPEKPPPFFLRRIAEAISVPGADEAGSAVPNFGEYYMAFGWWGILFGMAFYGIAYRVLWEWFNKNKEDAWVKLIYAINLGMIVLVIARGYTCQIVMEWVFLVLPILLGSLVFKR